MAERRRHKKRIQEVSDPTKEEKAVAKYLRFNCPTKSTNMMGQRVDYFTASKAVDCMLDSKWAKAKKGEEALFTTRESVVDYCNRLLKKKFFDRALKVMKKKTEKEIKKDKDKKAKGDSAKEEDKKGKKDKDKKKDVTDAGDSKKDKSDESPKKKKEVKKKFKLELHEDQIFVDGNEVYVWIYDPVPFKTFAMGLILVIAVIAATLFPLWPSEMRVGVYYLSVAAGVFVATILLLAIARCILFLFIWLVTAGRHHFWFLPNLTADVGFLDSFRPLYTHEYKGPREGGKSGSKKAKDDKGGASGGGGVEARKSDSDDNKSDSEKKEEEEDEEEEDDKERKSGEEEERRSDTDSERKEEDGSQHSNGNDFEMITREELDQHTEEDDDERKEKEEPKETPLGEEQS
ncbi:translocation protein SEC62 [Corythoichthys intestinalis]|uniref:translocation protein SEC62 n=1 Tax=Corythoichthys intestinalis TaxID=161448 RepID=UPI0025A652CB|nr:translocation protein SEC62 [Corythoichthys intestinalis]XP_061795011.1 translocation protein SEC62-like [Nerophis lumbriciformis]